MPIHTNIKKRRFELKMSQQELADAMGYKSRSTIAKIEAGENDIPHSKLVRFAQVLDTTVESLIGGASAAMPTTETMNFDGPKHIAVILAGGKSTRNSQNIPSQFVSVQGKPVIIYCLETYQRHPSINDIYVVCLKGWEGILQSYIQQYNITKLRKILPAGESGILSAKIAIDHILQNYPPDATVILQESTRPLVREEMISRLLPACHELGNAVTIERMDDYLQFYEEAGKINYIDRRRLVNFQSPEAYTLYTLQTLFASAAEKTHPLEESCCGMLMYNLGFPLHLCEGSRNNIKILRQEDISIFRALLNEMT